MGPGRGATVEGRRGITRSPSKLGVTRDLDDLNNYSVFEISSIRNEDMEHVQQSPISLILIYNSGMEVRVIRLGASHLRDKDDKREVPDAPAAQVQGQQSGETDFGSVRKPPSGVTTLLDRREIEG